MDKKWRSWTLSRIFGLAVLLCCGNIHGYRSYGLKESPPLSYNPSLSKSTRVSAFEALNHVSKRSEGGGEQKQGFYGFLGCLVNKDLCLREEKCIDDGLFGSCQSRNEPYDLYQYHLTQAQKEELESVLELLVLNGYSWRDLYTQCMVGDVLLAFQLHQAPDPGYCNDGSIPIRRLPGKEEWKERKKALEWSDGKYDEPNIEGAMDDYSTGDAAFLDVHKYQKQRRREPFYQSFSSFPLEDDIPEKDTKTEINSLNNDPNQNNDKVEEAILQYLMSLKQEDLDALDDWLNSDEEKDHINQALYGLLGTDKDSNSTADVTITQPDIEDQYEDSNDVKYVMDILNDLSDEKLDDGNLESLRNSPRYYEQTDVQVDQKRVILDLDPADSRPRSQIKIPPRRFDIVDTAHVYFTVDPKVQNIEAAQNILRELARALDIPVETFSRLSISGNLVDFRVDKAIGNVNASMVASAAMLHADEIKNTTGYHIIRTDIGGVPQTAFRVQELFATRSRYFVLLLSLCGVITGLLLTAILLYLLHRYLSVKEKVAQISESEAKKHALDPTKEYQDLCRQHMSSKLHDKPDHVHVLGRVSSMTSEAQGQSPSSRSSTSSWSEEPVSASMDILTGHMILTYMEDHLKNKDRLNKEWDSLKAYEPELIATTVAEQSSNKAKNRYLDIVPYDHSRVILQKERNQNSSDYINASTIMDHDPRNPAYIVTQGPLEGTVADFWQMIWENGCVVIVNLTKQKEKDTPLCCQYWPSEGSVIYHIYEVNLVSEHIWCEDYLIRSFYLKNLQTNETRTVTQFHYITWSDLGVPSSCKSLLDFRRKVNKSFRGRSCPILVHCRFPRWHIRDGAWQRFNLKSNQSQYKNYIKLSIIEQQSFTIKYGLSVTKSLDGAGRSGTYCLTDMVLNRINKGVKEIDIAATLEHIRDQRMQAVKTKEQFQFVLATVAEEVHAILKALPQ